MYDRRQVLIDLALVLILGGEAISDFQRLRHLAPVTGPVASTLTVWRALSEAGDLQLARVNTAVTRFRRHWRGILASRPEGFPWLRVAGRELTGITVADLDASIVFAASEKENAQATYKGGIGFCPNLATCDNTDDMLAIDPRPGGATSNCAADNIALPDLAVTRLPGPFRRRLLVRLDGAGFSHDLLEHIAAGGDVRGRNWEFSVGWSCTGKEMDVIERVPEAAWTAGIGQDGDLVDDTFVADLTGLLDLGAWQEKIPACGSSSGTSSCIPATANGPPNGRKSSAAATSSSPPAPRQDRSPGRRPPPLPRPRRERRQAGQGSRPEPVAVAALGDQRGLDPGRGPGREPAGLLPPPGITRQRATRRGSEAAALPAVPPASPHNPGPAQTMAPPPRRLAQDSGPDQRLAGSQGPARTGLTKLPATRRPGKTRPDRGNRRARRDSRTPNLPANRTT